MGTIPIAGISSDMLVDYYSFKDELKAKLIMSVGKPKGFGISPPVTDLINTSKNNLTAKELTEHKHKLAVMMDKELRDYKKILERDFEAMKVEYRKTSDIHQIVFLFDKIKDYLGPVMYESIIELETYLAKYREEV